MVIGLAWWVALAMLGRSIFAHCNRVDLSIDENEPYFLSPLNERVDLLMFDQNESNCLHVVLEFVKEAGKKKEMVFDLK